MTTNGLSAPSGSESEGRQPLAPGTQVDHYVIHSVLGAGGFGITYLASHHLLGRLYAIKEYFPDEFSYREGASVRSTAQSQPTYRWGLERFLAEARALAKFKHPSIVDVVSIFERNDTAYMVLAYEQGQDLSSWLKGLGRPPAQGEVDKIVVSLLSALEAVHERNLLHRDIAPDNILVRKDGSPVLIDFGSAREAVKNKSKVISAIVKRGYSPPEQYTSRPELQGPWSDIYALAATIHRMITGEAPVDATDRMLEDRLRPVGEVVRGAYRQTFLSAVDRALSIQAKDRPQTVGEWRDELFQLEEHEAVPRAGISGLTDRLRTGPAQVRQTGNVRPSRPPSQGIAAPPPPSAGGDKGELSWLDEDEEGKFRPHVAPIGAETPWSSLLYFGAIGLGSGAVTGALLSIVLASIFANRCSGDSCIAGYLPVCAGLGAMIGAAIGVRHAYMHRSLPTAMEYKEHDL